MVIDSKIFTQIIIVSLIYFIGISFYSIPINGIDISDKMMDIMYWVNDNLFVCYFVYLCYKLTIVKLIRTLLIGVFVFRVMLGMFQIMYILEYIHSELWWVLFAPLFIIFTLVIIKYKYVSSKRRFER